MNNSSTNHTESNGIDWVAALPFTQTRTQVDILFDLHDARHRLRLLAVCVVELEALSNNLNLEYESICLEVEGTTNTIDNSDPVAEIALKADQWIECQLELASTLDAVVDCQNAVTLLETEFRASGGTFDALISPIESGAADEK